MTTRTRQFANPWWLAVAAWLGVIGFSSTSAAGQDSEQAFFSLSSILFKYLHPNYTEARVIHFLADKGVHVAMFAELAILLWQAIPEWRWKIVAILLAGGFIGSCSEILQSFYPDRDPAIRDVLINLGGTALGIGICFAALRFRRRRSRPEHRHAEPLCDKFVR
ncbi:MAG: VanZ family protein [Bryobacteraceae bacterium]